ncbi:hypothetical protein [Candidiatus Paracoxiella cheracis]|uniref:hypothetical protein n=1 Tax=Candidiatus Paracoxiella cheracis TaxID=3405120 RepID=UPI003BF541B6
MGRHTHSPDNPPKQDDPVIQSPQGRKNPSIAINGHALFQPSVDPLIRHILRRQDELIKLLMNNFRTNKKTPKSVPLSSGESALLSRLTEKYHDIDMARSPCHLTLELLNKQPVGIPTTPEQSPEEVALALFEDLDTLEKYINKTGLTPVTQKELALFANKLSPNVEAIFKLAMEKHEVFTSSTAPAA